MSAATLAEVQGMDDAKILGIIDDYAKQVPFLSRLERIAVPGTTFKPPWISSAAAAEFRSPYAGVDFADAGIANRTVTLKYLDASCYVDKAIAEASSVGPEAYLALQMERKLIGGLKTIEKQALLGATNADSTGFSGFDDLFTSGTYLVDGGLTTGTCTHVYAVNTEEVKLYVGHDGRLEMGEVREDTVTDSSGKPFQAYVASCSLWVAVAYVGDNGARALINIAPASVRDSHISALINKFGEGFGPDLLVMNKAAIAGIQSGRTATSPTGAPAPYPTEVFGVPIAEVAIPSNISV